MDKLLAITAIGPDRAGLVRDLSQAVSGSGGSIRESRMIALGSEFAILMLVAGNWHTVTKIRDRLAEEEGLVLPPASSTLRRDGVVRDSLQSLLWRPRTFINMTFRKVHYGTERAEALLGPRGLGCPSLDGYFERLVRHVLSVAGATRLDRQVDGPSPDQRLQ